MKNLLFALTLSFILASCGSTSTPAQYKLSLSGNGGVGVCSLEQGYESESMCESEGISIPGQPAGKRTGITLPAEFTKVSSRSLYFTVELVTANEVQATLYRGGQICNSMTLKGMGQKFPVRCR